MRGRIQRHAVATRRGPPGCSDGKSHANPCATISERPAPVASRTNLEKTFSSFLMERSGWRRGRYNVERLIEKQGNAKILYLLSTLTNRPKTDFADIYDRCKARYEGLAVASRSASLTYRSQ